MGENGCKNGKECESWKGSNSLESFINGERNKHFERLYPSVENFLLDSGAFTFMQQEGGARGIDWDDYVERYAAFINKYDVKLFFELDIDSVCEGGLAEVERLRNKLEALTGKKSIPVWHVSRGKDYWLRMCDNYPYVAFGGIITDGISKSKIEKAFPWFISEAHKRGAKMHCLGYCSFDGLKRFKFDSCDASSWLYGAIGATWHEFVPNEGRIYYREKPTDKGRFKSGALMKHNYQQWCLYVKWARKYL